MKKGFLILFLITGLVTASLAQDDAGGKGFDKSRMFIGGYLGLSFSSYGTSINITPQVGYNFNQYFAAGVGINYAYYSYKPYYGYNWTAVQSYVGMNIFGRLYPIRQLFIQVQPEANYVWGSYPYGNGSEYKIPSQVVPSLLLGGGAAIPTGRGAIVLSLMYDVIQNTYSPYYGQAVFSFGYNMAF